MSTSEPITLTSDALARLVSGAVEGDPRARATHIASFETATPQSLVFMRDARYAKRWGESPAAIGVVSASAVDAARASVAAGATPAALRALILVPDADVAMVAILAHLAPPTILPPPGVHPTSVVANSAKVDPAARIGPQCVIGEHATIAANAVLLAQVFVGAHATIGNSTTLHPGVRVLERCVLGARCTMHAGVAIGADGFGYTPRPDGRGLLKVPHIGRVVIADDVEIGANSCVDRGKFGDTTIGSGTKIDNLVQVAHNVTIGRSCILCGNVGLAGSVTLGDGVILGGGVGVADGVTIGSGAKLAAYSAVSNDVPAGATYMGMPAMPASDARRMYAAMMRAGKRGRDETP